MTLKAKFLKPVAITSANLDAVVKAGHWITKDNRLQGRGRRQGPGRLQVGTRAVAAPPARPGGRHGA